MMGLLPFSIHINPDINASRVSTVKKIVINGSTITLLLLAKSFWGCQVLCVKNSLSLAPKKLNRFFFGVCWLHFRVVGKAAAVASGSERLRESWHRTTRAIKIYQSTKVHQKGYKNNFSRALLSPSELPSASGNWKCFFFYALKLSGAPLVNANAS